VKALIDLAVRFIFAVVAFTFGGWIGWLGILLVILKLIGVIHWPWWLAALPLEYGVPYSLYMTIDGALYRAGVKDVGGYARFTQSEFVAQHEQSKIQEIISEGPERIGSTIDALCENPNRRRFAQALLDAALTLLPASARYVRKQESERARYHKEVARCRPKASRRRHSGILSIRR
jgi:hypothetical protein